MYMQKEAATPSQTMIQFDLPCSRQSILNEQPRLHFKIKMFTCKISNRHTHVLQILNGHEQIVCVRPQCIGSASIIIPQIIAGK